MRCAPAVRCGGSAALGASARSPACACSRSPILDAAIGRCSSRSTVSSPCLAATHRRVCPVAKPCARWPTSSPARRRSSLPASVATAAAQLLPFQLEPLLALRTGVAARVLIADHVGLGKTVQAALIARDLLASRPGASILIAHAGRPARSVAGRASRSRRRRVARDRRRRAAIAVRRAPGRRQPVAAGPVVLASIDFVKQTDVLHGLRALVWDLLVVDEAHPLTIGSERLAAGRQLAARSAPPRPADGHAAQRRRGTLPCAVRSRPALVGRRARGVPPYPHRRGRRQSSAHAEARGHAVLRRTAPARIGSSATPAASGPMRRRPPAAPARMAMTVLFRRAASSPASLVRSLERRRALLTPGHDGVQSRLPFGADDRSRSGRRGRGARWHPGGTGPRHRTRAHLAEPAHRRGTGGDAR